MTVRISKLYGLNIYNENGLFLGKAYDFILNLENGEIVRVTTEPLKSISASKEELTKLLQKKSILYKRIKSVKDIIVVGKG